MSTQTPTPGPRHLVKIEKRGSRPEHYEIHVIADGQDVVLARVYHDWQEWEEFETNARLLVASWEMREYLDVTAGILAWAKDHGADAAAVGGLERMRSALLARIDGMDDANRCTSTLSGMRCERKAGHPEYPNHKHGTAMWERGDNE